MINEKISKSVYKIILFCILSVSICSTSAYAVYYEGSFPYDETALTGGGYIECGSSIGDIVILLPQQYIDNYLTFTTSGNLFNVSNANISCLVFKNGQSYSARFQSFSTLEYRIQSGVNYTYTPIVTNSIQDTNCIFMTESERINDNYYFTQYEIASLSVQIAILFFVFLGWFLWHRKS